MNNLLIEYIDLFYDTQKINEDVNSGGPVTLRNVLLQRAGAKNQNGRVYPRPILEREAGKYLQEFVQQRRALGELDHPDCESGDAEVLTTTGWQNIKEIKVSDKIFTLNTNTGNVEINSVLRVVNQPYKGKMISIKGKNIGTLVTPNHRFILQDRKGNYIEKTAQELLELSKTIKVTHLTIPKVANAWIGKHYDEFIIASCEVSPQATWEIKARASNPLILNAEAWFEFLGIYLAEGHVQNRNIKKGYAVYITQNEGVKADRIRTVLKNLTSELEWTERKNKKKILFVVTDARLHTYLSQLGSKYNKFIPSDIKNASTPLLQNLFNGYLMGDGTIVEHKGYLRTSIFSVSNRLMEDFQEVLLKLGMTGRIKQQVSTRTYAYAGHDVVPEKKRPLYRLWIEKSKNIHLDFRFIDIEEVDYDDTVHCVTVENGTFYCRDNGKTYWSGNSTVINLKNVSHVITEMHWNGDDLVGTVEILSTPSGNIVKELMKNGIRLGVSSRGVGSVRQLGENTVEVEEDFALLGWDIVSNPSTQGAFLNENTLVRTKKDRVSSLITDFFTELGA